MSEGSQQTDAAALAQLDASATTLEAALRKAGLVNRLIFLSFLVIVVVVAWRGHTIISQVEEVQWQEKMTAALKESFAQNEDQYQAEMHKLWVVIQPKLAASFKKQLQKDSPRFREAFITERDAFQKNTQVRLREALREHLKTALDRHEVILQQEFPELRDKKQSSKIIAYVQIAMQELIEKYYMAAFEEQFEILYASYENFPIADPPDTKTQEKPLPTQFVGQLLELMKLKLISPPDVSLAPLTGTSDD